jgi:hypothetical protein
VVGGWRTDLGKVNNTLISGEDHEIFLRLQRHGSYRGYYDPQLMVRHHVPEGRLTRRYFRRWFFWHGKTQALMLDDLFPDLNMDSVPRVAGVPRFLYRQGTEQLWRYVRALVTGNALERLIEELLTIRYAGLFLARWRGVLSRLGRRSDAGTPVVSSDPRGQVSRVSHITREPPVVSRGEPERT